MTEYDLLKAIHKHFGSENFNLELVSAELFIDADHIKPIYETLKNRGFIKDSVHDEGLFAQKQSITVLGTNYLKKMKQKNFWFYFEKINSLIAVLISLFALFISYLSYRSK